jgi:SNF2 family DNA or RNA helicase
VSLTEAEAARATTSAEIAHQQDGYQYDKTVAPEVRPDSSGAINADIALSRAPDADLYVPGIDLYPHQRATVAYCIRNKRVIVAEPTGTGKTVSALAVLRATSSTPCVVIAPKSLVPMWITEALRFGAVSTTQEIERADDSVQGQELTAVSYGMLSYDQSDRANTILSTRLCDIEPRMVIADESHALRGDSLRSSAAEQIMQTATYRLLLTGTPVAKNTQDLDRQLSILEQEVNTGGTPDQVNRRLRSNCYVRHDREAVLDDLPDRRRRVVEVEIDNRAEYKQKMDQYIHELSERTGFKGLYEFRRTAALGKLYYVKRLADDLRGPIVLFAIHRDVQNRLIEAFPDAAHVLSGLSANRRQEEIESFQSGETDVIICAIGTTPEQSPGGVGIELTRADHGIFCELGWTHAHLWQAGNRIHRIGQQNPVTLWFPIAQDTIDEHVWSLVEERRMITNEATTGRIDPQQILNRLR